MKRRNIYFDYIKKTALIWILFLICIYTVLACEFESLRLGAFSINQDGAYVDKINGILKNLSFSYIAGVIFFFLSDTIPFLRRRTMVNKHIVNALTMMVKSIDDFSFMINGKTWDSYTDTRILFEDYTGREYANDMPLYELKANLLTICKKLSEELSIHVDFVISQELYLEKKLLHDIEKIRTNEYYILLNALSNQKHIPSQKLIGIFEMLIEIKKTINKYLL